MRRVSLFAALVLFAIAAYAQRNRFGRFFGGGDEAQSVFPKDAEFHFVRMEYTDLPQYRRGFGFVSRDGRAGGWWAQDWPDAEEHFSAGVQRLTRIEVGDPRHMGLTDSDKIFDYPWIYATQTGNWDLTKAETDRLGEYLRRGGYLVVDDMWGESEYEVFLRAMQRALPNQPISDIALTDSVMHVMYSIEQKDLTFIPGSRHLRGSRTGGVQVVQPYGTAPAWRSINDEKDHMVVAINYDTDVGDAWEFADVPYYPEAMTSLAYRYGINYLIYSITH
jgi:hypothetical protein